MVIAISSADRPASMLPIKIALGCALAATLVLAATNVWHDRLFHHASADAGASAKPAEADSAKSHADPKTTVVLPGGKFEAIGVKLEAASRVDLPTEVDVSGQIVANPDRYIEIHPRASGVIRAVLVEGGARVKKGDVLAVLDSGDVGKARLDLRARQRDLATARTEADWKREVALNVEAIIPLLRKNTPAKDLNIQFEGKSLGAFRASLLGGYADYEIARHEEEKQTDLFKKEVIGEHPYYLAIHTREGKQAKFEAELEQVRFDAAQQRKVADQQVRNAEAGVIDAAQRLRLLGVTEDLAALLSPGISIAVTTIVDDEDVTRYTIVAPFDGVILARSAAVSQRVDVTDVLFSVVDPSNARVLANVPESDISILPQLGNAKVRVKAAAYPDKTFEASILSVGAEVDSKTRTVPLRAALTNPDGLLKIGLFVRVVLDSSTRQNVLTVPASALMEIDEKTGVFVPDAEPRSFRFHAVKAGREVAGRRVITSGLKPGDEVVSIGAFLLKSELILQNETDEE